MSSRGGWFGVVVGLAFLLISADWASAMSPRYVMLGRGKLVDVEGPNLLRIRIDGEKGTVPVRLLGVGSPKNKDRVKGLRPEVISYIHKADMWTRAVQYVRSALDGKIVEVWTRRWDRMDEKNRLLAYVMIPVESGEPVDLNAEIIRKGMGFVTRDYVHVTFAGYRHLEEEAKRNRLGLWSALSFGRVSSLDN